MVVEAAGGVVYSHNPKGQLVILLIQDRHGVWTLPKGHLEDDETEEIAALREITEETGLQTELIQLIQRVRYPIFKHGDWIDKQVSYFLATCAYAPPEPQTAEGIRDARWLVPATAIALLGYAQVREVVRRGLNLIPAPEDS